MHKKCVPHCFVLQTFFTRQLWKTTANFKFGNIKTRKQNASKDLIINFFVFQKVPGAVSPLPALFPAAPFMSFFQRQLQLPRVRNAVSVRSAPHSTQPTWFLCFTCKTHFCFSAYAHLVMKIWDFHSVREITSVRPGHIVITHEHTPAGCWQRCQPKSRSQWRTVEEAVPASESTVSTEDDSVKEEGLTLPSFFIIKNIYIFERDSVQ